MKAKAYNLSYTTTYYYSNVSVFSQFCMRTSTCIGVIMNGILYLFKPLLSLSLNIYAQAILDEIYIDFVYPYLPTNHPSTLIPNRIHCYKRQIEYLLYGIPILLDATYLSFQHAERALQLFNKFQGLITSHACSNRTNLENYGKMC